MTKTILAFGLFIIMFCSCKKETGVTGPAGPAGANGLDGNLLDTGTLTGKLGVYNEFSWPSADSGNVTVSLKVNGSPRSVISDKSGNYQFTGLPAGTYNLVFEKSGYGTMKLFGISHFAPGKIPTVVPEVYLLEKKVKTAIKDITMTDGGSYIILKIILDTSSVGYKQYQGNFMVLVGTNANLDVSNGTQSTYNQFISPQPDGSYQLLAGKASLGGNIPALPYYVTVGSYNRLVHNPKYPLNLVDTENYSDYINPDDGKHVYPNLQLAPNVLMVQ